MKQLQAILLDIDGTLLLSNNAHAQSWIDAYAESGYTVPFEKVQPLIGMGSEQLIATVTPELSDEEEVSNQIKELRKQIFLQRYVGSLRPSPGARDLLLRLKEVGLRLVIATSASSEELEKLMKAAA